MSECFETDMQGFMLTYNGVTLTVLDSMGGGQDLGSVTYEAEATMLVGDYR